MFVRIGVVLFSTCFGIVKESLILLASLSYCVAADLRMKLTMLGMSRPKGDKTVIFFISVMLSKGQTFFQMHFR